MQAAAKSISAPVLIALVGAVSLAHLVVLGALWNEPVPAALLPNIVFNTRAIEIPALPVPAQKPVARARSANPGAPMSAPVLLPAPSSEAQAPEPAAEPVALAAPVQAQAAQAPSEAASEARSEPAAPPVEAAAPVLSPALAEPAPAGAARDATLALRAYTVPGSVRLKFGATGQRAGLNYHASGELLWLQDGQRYDARMEIGAFLLGSRVVSSTGQLGPDGLAPKRYSDKFRSELAAHFDRERERISFSANTPDAILLPGAQDQLSVFIQLASMLAGEPSRYPAGSSIAVQTAGSKSAEPWIFNVVGPEAQTLPGGELATLKVERVARREFDQRFEVWLAPALAYLPARIRITQANGDFVDQQWRGTAAP